MIKLKPSPVSFFAHVGRLPERGMPVVIEADEEQRRRLAEDHGLIAVDRYRAELLVSRWKRPPHGGRGSSAGGSFSSCAGKTGKECVASRARGD